MIDRLEVETTVLDNGITLYEKAMDVPFAHARFVVPIGHAHNTNGFLPGSAHLIEHLICARSEKYPSKGSFKEKLGLMGGSSNAGTANFWTEFSMDVPSIVFNEFFPDFIERIKFPLITKEFIDQESGIILNESLKRKWYPGNNELGLYYLTQWKFDNPVERKVVFGEQDDFNLMNPDTLRLLHQYYFTKDIYVVVGGNYDRDLVVEELSKIEILNIPENNIPYAYKKIHWENKNYHEKEFFESDRYVYNFGGMIETDDISKMCAMNFTGNLMINGIHGPMHQWLRRDSGMVYNLRFDFNFAKKLRPVDWCFSFPFSNHADVIKTKDHILDFIEKALNDEDLLKREVTRIRNSSVYHYQTLQSIVSQTLWSIRSFGMPINEPFQREKLEMCANKKFIRDVFEQFSAPQLTGEFLAMPIQKT